MTLALALTLFLAQDRRGAPPQQPAPAPPAATSPAQPRPLVEETPVVTKHSITVNGKTLNYTATTGQLPIKSATGEIEALMFYIAYTLDGTPDKKTRPLLFSFNGGPGSSSVWLHMGALGPKRVKMLDDGNLPPAPYQLIDNEGTWLDETDLVFIDPVGTGYSRAARQDLAQRFNSVRGDIQSVGEFIRLYLTRNERWQSPLFLAGESYGTFRAAGLAGALVDQGIALNGIYLISTILQYQTVLTTRGNDLPHILMLPTYTATAWYHKKLPADLQKDLKKALAESEAWAITGYAEALAKGDRMTAAQRKAAVDKMARLTGLDPRYVDESELRIPLPRFNRELLRDRKLMVGRLDSRLTGPAPLDAGDSYEFDPSNSAIRPPYTSLFNQYVREQLGYKSDATYFILGGGIQPWDFNSQNQFVETGDALRAAFAKNPHMKVFVGYGYYDMATPYFAAEYTLSHLGLHPAARANFTHKYYEAGHMMYIHKPSLLQLKQDAAEFLRKSIPPR